MEGHPLDRSQTISLHFVEGPGISFQETTAPTVAASTIWLWDTLEAWQEGAASWYPVKSLFRGLWAIRHRIRGEVHPRHSILPVPDHQLKELQRETACDPIVQFVKKAILDGFLDTMDEQPAAIHRYRVSSNNSWGRSFLFWHKKGAIIRGKAIIWGRRLCQCISNIAHWNACPKYFVLFSH